MNDIWRFCLNKHITGCYCACHSPLSSCPSCEHCTGDNDVAKDYQRRYRELLLAMGDEQYRAICQAEIDWYRRYGKYPERITGDSHGAQYVIGDQSWNQRNPHRPEAIEHLMPRLGSHHQAGRG